MTRIHSERLRRLRNDVPIVELIAELGIPVSRRGSRSVFRCPTCEDFASAVNPRTNLARCFRCRRNFNPIELVMAERRLRFLDAIAYLEGLLAPSSQ